MIWLNLAADTCDHGMTQLCSRLSLSCPFTQAFHFSFLLSWADDSWWACDLWQSYSCHLSSWNTGWVWSVLLLQVQLNITGYLDEKERINRGEIVSLSRFLVLERHFCHFWTPDEETKMYHYTKKKVIRLFISTEVWTSERFQLW